MKNKIEIVNVKDPTTIISKTKIVHQI